MQTSIIAQSAGLHSRRKRYPRERSGYRMFGFAHRVPTGIWCSGVKCLGSTCNVAELFDDATTASAGAGASCSWRDATTVLVIFGQGRNIDSWSPKMSKSLLLHEHRTSENTCAVIFFKDGKTMLTRNGPNISSTGARLQFRVWKVRCRNVLPRLQNLSSTYHTRHAFCFE